MALRVNNQCAQCAQERNRARARARAKKTDLLLTKINVRAPFGMVERV